MSLEFGYLLFELIDDKGSLLILNFREMGIINSFHKIPDFLFHFDNRFFNCSDIRFNIINFLCDIPKSAGLVITEIF